MGGFSQPVDIANRALQHCGASRITTLADDDKGAAEISQCYDGLRRAELRRNVWTFSVRRAVLYPINTAVSSLPFGSATTNPISPKDISDTLPTLLLKPNAWSATLSYDFASIVSHNGATWVSVEPFNVGNEPGTPGDTTWDTYFGSLCVQAWNSKGPGPANTYFMGDLVYTTDSDGEISVFVSLENDNDENPATASAWSATQTYDVGDVVQDSASYFWQSAINLNTGNQPGAYGPWSATPTYAIGALVIGSDQVLYKALLSNQNHNPAAGASPTQWSVVGNPGSWPLWNSTSTYAEGDFAAGTDGEVYQSVQGSNIGHQPVGSTYNPNTPSTNWWIGVRRKNPWIANFASSTCNATWLRLDADVETLNINYPIGSGPSIQTTTKNVFLLPNGFLRKAPQDPKRGSISFLGAPTGRMYDDQDIDGKYIISASPFPIILRFAADITQVSKMDDMFCEGLGCRVAAEVCETLTQSGSKLQAIANAYKKFMDEARTVNGIEQGPTEPPEDDYITCRI